MISVEGLKVEFNATPLFEDVSYVINKKDRIALVGKRVIIFLRLCALAPADGAARRQRQRQHEGERACYCFHGLVLPFAFCSYAA